MRAFFVAVAFLGLYASLEFILPAVAFAASGSSVLARSSETKSNGGTLDLGPSITIAPTSGTVGITVTITGYGGANFSSIASNNSVTFNGVGATVTSATTTQLVVTVPPGSTTGPVIVQTCTSSGSSVHPSPSLSGLNAPASCGSSLSGGTYTVTSAPSVPSIESFAPTSGVINDQVTLSAINANPTTTGNTVKFNGVATTVTSVIAIGGGVSRLAVKVPAGATTGALSLTVGSQTAYSSSSFIVVVPPTINSFSPASGPIGTSIIINGTNFGTTPGSNTVTLNGLQLSVTAASATQLTVTVPAAATSGLLSVTVSGKTATSVSNFTVTAPLNAPTIASFTPGSGAVGASVSISGSNYNGTTPGSNVVKFNGVSANVIAATAIQLTVTVPVGATSGAITVTVGGNIATSSSSFTVIPASAPTIASFAPTAANVGNSVIITGTNYSPTPANDSVKFGGISAAVTAATTTQLTVTVPPGASSGAISVTVGGLTAYSGGNFTVVPVITGFSPSIGPVGTVVTINCAYVQGAGSPVAPAVTFNGISSAAVSSTLTSSPTANPTTYQVTAVVPPSATTGSIKLTWMGTTITSASNFTIGTSPTPPPTITTFSPGSGPVGTPVTITGTNYSTTLANNTVKFNGLVATVTAATATQLQTTVPVNATTGPITVTVGGLSGISATNFVVTVPQTITFSPTSGAIGSAVTITGTGTSFSTSPENNDIRFNGVRASYPAATAIATQTPVIVPPTATTGPITYYVNGNLVATSASNFTVTSVTAPTCTSQAPANAVVSATATTQRVYAYGVQNATLVQFPTWWIDGGNQNDLQWLQGTNDGGGTWHVDIQLSQYDADVPRYGNFATHVYLDNTAYNNNAPVFCGGGQWVRSAPVAALAVTGFNPQSGAAGTPVQISGTGFSTTIPNNISFNGVAATPQIATSSISLNATVPAGASTGKITVAVNGQTASSVSNFIVPTAGRTPPTLPALTTAPIEDINSTKVGATSGQFSVDQGGNAQYRVPLYTPRGAGGLTPGLALTYSSGAGDGPFGIGWQLEGLSSISICRKTQEHGDGVGVSGVAETNPAKSVYCLDGQRLVLTSGAGTNGTTSAQYRLENDSFSKIVIENASTQNGGGNAGIAAYTVPTIFTVYGKDGTIRRYGNDNGQHNAQLTWQRPSDGATFTKSWFVYQLQDTNQNSVYFNYTRTTAPAASLLISSIDYVGGRIDFATSPRTYNQQDVSLLSYQAGIAVSQTAWITGIAVKSLINNTTTGVRNYNLIYTPLINNPAQNQMTSLKECVDTTNATCYAPLVFQWADVTAWGASTTNPGLSVKNAPGTETFYDAKTDSVRFGDINGDGRSDVVWVHLNHDGSSHHGSFHIGFSSDSNLAGSPYFNVTSNASAFSAVDTDGPCGDSNDGTPNNPCPQQYKKLDKSKSFQLIDFNGDGKDDLMMLEPTTSFEGGPDNYRFVIWLSDGTTFKTKLTNITTNSALGHAMPLTKDPANQTNQHSHSGSLVIADLDGDGLPDAFVLNDTSATVWLLKPHTCQSTTDTCPYQFEGPYNVAFGSTQTPS